MAEDFNIDLKELAFALSGALGLVGGDIIDHGKRVACIALHVARELDLSNRDLQDLWFATLLHDAGVSQTEHHKRLLQLEWEEAEIHCQNGARLLAGFHPFSFPAQLILHHHARWEHLAKQNLPEKTALLANLIFLADRTDILIDWEKDILAGQTRIQRKIEGLSGSLFNPALVNRFLEVSEKESFWFGLEPQHLPQALDCALDGEPTRVGLNELESIAHIFGVIVDRKSPYTLLHSEGVARVAEFFGQALDIDGQRVQMLRIAGLLHDLGKLAVPDHILDKPTLLNAKEQRVIKRHPFETYQVLGQVKGLEEIRDWAAFHHERPDGSGYPFRHGADILRTEHLVVIMADILQAMLHDRPYRLGLDQEHILEILDHLTESYPVFGPLVAITRQNFERLRVLALEARDAPAA